MAALSDPNWHSRGLESGFAWTPLKEAITAHHPAGTNLNPGNLTQALQSTASLQVTKNIKPIILDWDETNRKLTVVDRGFPIWLDYQDRSVLLQEIGLPSGTTAQAPVFGKIENCGPKSEV